MAAGLVEYVHTVVSGGRQAQNKKRREESN